MGFASNVSMVNARAGGVMFGMAICMLEALVLLALVRWWTREALPVQTRTTPSFPITM